VSPALVSSLLAAAAANPDYGILGPVIGFMDEPHAIMTDGCAFNRGTEPGFFERVPVSIGASSPPPVQSVDIVNGCCVMLSASLLRRAGLIDERFFLVHEESDLCLRARHAGFRCGVVGAMLVWHKGSSAFKRTGRRLQRYYDARNLQLLLRRHLGRAPGRRARASWLAYAKYVYYRYCLEMESREPEAGVAVIEGVYDGLARIHGRYQGRPRPLVPLMQFVFDVRRRFPTRGGSSVAA
jgi:GT2 family glycosyltransferase